MPKLRNKLRNALMSESIDNDTMEKAVAVALRRKCRDKQFARTTLREAINKTDDPDKRHILLERAIAWTIEELYGEKVDNVNKLFQEDAYAGWFNAFLRALFVVSNEC